MATDRTADPQLVVIGSSAGGIEALSRLVASLPADFPAPIVIAQHLDPRRPSHLDEILARHARVPVKVVEASTPLESGVIFVVPSDRMVDIADGRLHSRPATRGAIAPSVDLLLESAAAAFGPGLIAVILTGTGSDGAAGAWHVKQAGGSVVIQDPETAAFPSMPRSISPALVDATADLDALGVVVLDMVAAGGATPAGREGRAFAALLERIRDRSGIDFSLYKTATIVRRLRGRMTATGHDSLTAYGRQLETDPEEYTKLLASLLIKVTEFFRDPKVFDRLRDGILPEIIENARRDGRQVRVWSAGCSTGEEAYSLAITLDEAMAATGGRRPDVRVFATDLDPAAIAYARRGIYPTAALKKIPAAVRERCFRPVDGGYEVVRSLRSLMTFGEHDLGARAPFPRIDLILCRNVLIYFTQPMQRAALETFGFSLRDDGLLVLGPSETVAALPERYVEDVGRLRIYRRLPGQTTLPFGRSKPIRPPHVAAAPLVSAIQATRRDVDAAMLAGDLAESLLIDLGLGLVVVDRHYDIVRINTAARRILGIHGLAFDQDFIHLAESLPSTAIRAAIDGALAGSSTTAIHQIEAGDVSTDSVRFIQVVIRPHRPAHPYLEGAIIELADLSDIERERVGHGLVARRLDRAVVANRRLLQANEELTALVAELRLTNRAMLESSEDAQSGREEVETLNEEFQATNEELETLNEELTASVEELRVANEDLAAKTTTLRAQTEVLVEQRQQGEEEHNRLQAVLGSLGDAVLAVDHEGRTLVTNAAFERLFGGPGPGLRPEDLAGLPLPPRDWPQQRAARGERFRTEFAAVDRNGTSRWYEAVAEPLTTKDRTWGGVVAFRDLSERTMRQSLERLMAAAGHELRTPSAAIHNYLQLVARHVAEEDLVGASRYTDRALYQTRRLASLVERLLDVSRIQSSQLDLEVGDVDLGAVVRAAIDVAQLLPKAPPIKLRAPSVAVSLSGDRDRLEQVFLNVLVNAVEHASGTPTINVSVRTSGDRAVVTVRDHGPGIDPRDLHRMFEPYARLGPPHRAAGLGLGLYVAREIVIAHGGEIDATSRAGKGTVVTVRLPLRPIARGRKASRPS